MLNILFQLCKPIYFCTGSSGSSHSSSQTAPAPIRGELASNLSGLLGYNVSPEASLSTSGVTQGGGLGTSQKENTLLKQIANIQGKVSKNTNVLGQLNPTGTKLQSKITADQAALKALGYNPDAANNNANVAAGQAAPGTNTTQQNALNNLLQNPAQYNQLGQEATQLALDPTSSSTYQKMMASLQQQFLNNLGQADVQTGSRFAMGGQYNPNTSSPLAQAFAQQAGTGEQALSTAGLQQAFGMIPTEQTAANQYQMTIPNLLALLGPLLGSGTSGSSQVAGGI